MDARVGSMHWSDGHRQNARHCRQADEEDAERVHTGVHHVLGENFSESDARSYRRKARQTVGAPGLSIGTGWAGAEPPPVENRSLPLPNEVMPKLHLRFVDVWLLCQSAT